MESLLCDEVWLSSPASPIETQHVENVTYRSLDNSDDHNNNIYGKCHMSKEDCEEALRMSLREEKRYIPHPKYVEYLTSNNLIVARFKSIQWFIKRRIHLNLSSETVFYAANYFDRFISMNQCNIEWQYWMVELLAVACLSIASKFSGTNNSTLHDINQIIMDDMEHWFQPSMIQRMELTILQSLDWHLGCTTAYSYVEMFTRNLHITFQPHLHQEIVTQVNGLLLLAISDTKILEFRPSVVAMSALRCCLDKLHSTSSVAHHSCLTKFFNEDQKVFQQESFQWDELARCRKMMEMQWIGTGSYKFVTHDQGQCPNNCPSSPTTVLLKERINIRDFNIDLSLYGIQRPKFNGDHQARARKQQRKSEEP